MSADKHKPVKSSKKEIYGPRSVAHTNGNGDKMSESFRSVFELALESQGSERTALLLEKLAHELRSEPRPAGGLRARVGMQGGMYPSGRRGMGQLTRLLR